MEQKLGDVGSMNESFSKGVASVVGEANLAQTEWGLKAAVSLKADLDACVLIDYLAKKIGGPVPAEVAQFLEMALKAV